MSLAFSNIGGGVVRRRFTMAGGRAAMMGEILSAAEVRAIPPRNLRALLDSNALEVWPAAPEQAAPERHVVHIGRGLYDVFEGRKLNAEPVSREEAEAIAIQTEKGS